MNREATNILRHVDTLEDEPFGSCIAHRAQLWQSAFPCEDKRHEDQCLDIALVCGHGCTADAFHG